LQLRNIDGDWHSFHLVHAKLSTSSPFPANAVAW
jgi:hypothetical protein